MTKLQRLQCEKSKIWKSLRLWRLPWIYFPGCCDSIYYKLYKRFYKILLTHLCVRRQIVECCHMETKFTWFGEFTKADTETGEVFPANMCSLLHDVLWYVINSLLVQTKAIGTIRSVYQLLDIFTDAEERNYKYMFTYNKKTF